MKFLPAQLAYLLRDRRAHRNIGALLRYIAALVALVLVYSALFHFIMLYEGREHSWLTGAYWTLTVMTTLGFGDITFQSDLGRAFSMLVMLSGVVFLLTLLPFTFIQFFYAPWMEAQEALRTPRRLPEETRDHVLLTGMDPVSSAMVRRLETAGREYAVIVGDLKEAQALSDRGVTVVVGEVDDPATYERVGAGRAAMLFASGTDAVNTNVTFTARAAAPGLKIVATAGSEQGEEILKRAGADHVLRLSDLMAQALSRCAVGGDAVSHVVAEVDEVLIAEASVARTPLIGKTLRESRLSEIGVSVLGVWERGSFTLGTADTRLDDRSILVLAGSRAQLDAYDEALAIYNVSGEATLILGGGRVGRATAAALRERGIAYRIVALEGERVKGDPNALVGDASKLKTLETAGVRTAPTVIVTTHDDNLNIYLTIFCKSLRAEAQIISRCTHERNVATLHRAGADHVLSYSGMGAWTLMSLLSGTRMLAMAEGLEVVRAKVPASLVGKTVRESGIRERVGCTVVAVKGPGGSTINPPADRVLVAGEELVLVGGVDAEARFRREFR